MTRVEKLTHLALLLTTLALAATGLWGWLLVERLEGYGLIAHMAAAGLFLPAFAVSAVLWGERYGARSPGGGAPRTIEKWTFWLVTPLGLAVAGVMLAAMTPWFGDEAQDVLAATHRYTAAAFVVVMTVHTFLSLSRKPNTR